jgi:diguanylate cyclase (GGDEF)-like protein
MEEIIRKISEETLNELKKAKKPPYPLYYKEIFVVLLKEKKLYEHLNTKLLCEMPNVNEILINKTAQTIKDINESSNDIKENSIKLLEEIEPVETENVKNLVIQYSSKLLDTVNKMQNKIQELEVELEKAYQELLIDPLTKAFNRKAFEKNIKRTLKIGKNKNLDLALAVVDLDHFKRINDTYGHLVGDFVLKKLVEIIKSLIRKEHHIYRLGGDEFVILMNRTDLKSAEKVVDRIISSIKKTKLKYKDQIIEITVSIGLTMHKKGDTAESIIKRADEALYKAKKNRNKYEIKV